MMITRLIYEVNQRRLDRSFPVLQIIAGLEHIKMNLDLKG